MNIKIEKVSYVKSDSHNLFYNLANKSIWRVPYNIKITNSKLKQVEKAENFIKSLGIKQLRVRYHNEIARIEVLKNDFNIILKNSDEIKNM